MRVDVRQEVREFLEHLRNDYDVDRIIIDYNDDFHYIELNDGFVFSEDLVEDSNNTDEEDDLRFDNLDFSEAFSFARVGFGIRLSHWNPEVVVYSQEPDEYSKNTHPYLYVESRVGRVPWNMTQPELFSEKWEIVVPNDFD